MAPLQRKSPQLRYISVIPSPTPEKGSPQKETKLQAIITMASRPVLWPMPLRPPAVQQEVWDFHGTCTASIPGPKKEVQKNTRYQVPEGIQHPCNRAVQ